MSANHHCGHAPYCVNKGESDERDPLGHCRCGDREREAVGAAFAADAANLDTPFAQSEAQK